MSGVLLVAFFVFMIGYAIGYAAFSKSEMRIFGAVLCGVAAIIVTSAVIFVGCTMMFRGM